jgi:hypothetical protein
VGAGSCGKLESDKKYYAFETSWFNTFAKEVLAKTMRDFDLCLQAGFPTFFSGTPVANGEMTSRGVLFH